jgi:hypothetical protein
MSQQQALPQGVTVGSPCPVCKVGVITEDFSCCGIALAILCFPLGIICCLLMKEKKCSSCGATL